MGKANHMAKDEYISFRTSTEVRRILEKIAKDGFRTLSQQVEMCVIKYLQSEGHKIEED